jgi:hypothetical protein
MGWPGVSRLRGFSSPAHHYRDKPDTGLTFPLELSL